MTNHEPNNLVYYYLLVYFTLLMIMACKAMGTSVSFFVLLLKILFLVYSMYIFSLKIFFSNTCFLKNVLQKQKNQFLGSIWTFHFQSIGRKANNYLFSWICTTYFIWFISSEFARTWGQEHECRKKQFKNQKKSKCILTVFL